MNLDFNIKLEIVHNQVLEGKALKTKLLNNIVFRYMSLDFFTCLSPQ
jgi:hypothetical protein